MIVQHQHAFAGSAGPAPLGKTHAQRLVERLSRDPPRFVAFPSALEIAEREIEASFAADRLDAAEPLGPFERGARFLQAVERAQRQRLAAERGGEVGPDGARQAIGVERLGDPVEFQLRVAEIDRRFGEVRPQAERFARRGGRFFQPAELAERAGAAVPEIGVAGLEGERSFERVQRLGAPPHVEEQLSDIRPGGRQIELEADGAPVELQRRRALARFAEDVAAHAQRLGELGIRAQRGVQESDRLRPAPALPHCDAARVERFGGLAGQRAGRRPVKTGGARPSRRRVGVRKANRCSRRFLFQGDASGRSGQFRGASRRAAKRATLARDLPPRSARRRLATRSLTILPAERETLQARNHVAAERRSGGRETAVVGVRADEVGQNRRRRRDRRRRVAVR